MAQWRPGGVAGQERAQKRGEQPPARGVGVWSAPSQAVVQERPATTHRPRRTSRKRRRACKCSGDCRLAEATHPFAAAPAPVEHSRGRAALQQQLHHLCAERHHCGITGRRRGERRESAPLSAPIAPAAPRPMRLRAYHTEPAAAVAGTAAAAASRSAVRRRRASWRARRAGPTSLWPLRHAQCSGVLPSLFFRLGD